MEFKRPNYLRKVENIALSAGLALVLYGANLAYNFHSVATSRDAITSLRVELSRMQENLDLMVSNEDSIKKEIANNEQAIRLSMKRVNTFYDF